MRYIYAPDGSTIEILNLGFSRFKEICALQGVFVSKNEFDAGGYDDRYGAQVVTEVEPPVIDEATQYRREATPLKVNGTWTQQWSVQDYSPEEIERRLSRTLNWEAFDGRLTNVDDSSSPYSQISQWCVTNYVLIDAKNNIANAIDRQSHKLIYVAFKYLSQILNANQSLNFTSAQITEINVCLETLGVTWRWEDL